MNSTIDLTLSLAADGSALPSLFFRAADRLRLEACVAALTQEGRSVALSSQHDAALDHYGKLLAERLRRACPQSQIETYFPVSTEALVGQFNQALASQTVREAMAEGVALAPQRIWVIHDAGALAEHELQLMARLVSHFPGSNIRVVLLLGPARRSRKAFESLGRRFVRWDIEGPTAEQAQTMLAQSRIEGCERLVSQLLRHLQPEVVGPDLRELSAHTPEPFSFRQGDDGRALEPSLPPGPAQKRLASWLGLPVKCMARVRSALKSLRAFEPLKLLKSYIAGQRSASAKSGTGGQVDAPSAATQAARPSRLRWVLAIAGLVGLSVAVSAALHGARFGVLKPAGPQPAKAARTAPNALDIKPAVSGGDSVILPGRSNS